MIAAAPHAEKHEALDLADIRNSLRSLMWRSVGITRDAKGLADAADQVERWCRYVLGQVFEDPAGWTLQNMLTVARLMIAAAAERRESRGCTCAAISRGQIRPGRTTSRCAARMWLSRQAKRWTNHRIIPPSAPNEIRGNDDAPQRVDSVAVARRDGLDPGGKPGCDRGDDGAQPRARSPWRPTVCAPVRRTKSPRSLQERFRFTRTDGSTTAGWQSPPISRHP